MVISPLPWYADAGRETVVAIERIVVESRTAAVDKTHTARRQRNNATHPIIPISTFSLILINTIFISFMKNYNYAYGTFDGFTFDNFLVILGLKNVGDGGTRETRLI